MLLSSGKAFQNESTLSICLNINELLAPKRRDIENLSDCNRTPTQNHLAGKQTINHLIKLAKRLSFLATNYLYRAFDCMLLPYYHVDPGAVT